MARYWWVNHKQTARQEIDGQYLWSPKRKRDGARNQFYDNMRDASPGDLVLSYSDGALRFVGRVAEFAFTSPKPAEFGAIGSYWNREGWYLPVYWTPLLPAIRPRDHLEEIRSYLPLRYSPIRPENGAGNQAAYLAAISEDLFKILIERVSYNQSALKSGGANSLNYDVIREMLDDAEQRAVEMDDSLNETEKETLIKARRGQGKFRVNVSKFEHACRLTGVTNPDLLIASHVKPWRVCRTAEERLDGRNGLLLTPDADRLFDRGYVSFTSDGLTIVSKRADPEDLRRLGFEKLVPYVGAVADPHGEWSAPKPAMPQEAYMTYHRSDVLLR